MAVLDATGRARLVAQWMRNNLASSAFAKPDLIAAAAATDDWIEANKAAYNAALPLPFRTAATTAQKDDLFAAVLARRVGRYHAEEDG